MVLILILSCMLTTTATAAAEPPALTYAGWSLTLQNDLSLNYMVDEKYFTEYGYANPAVTFVMGTRTVTVTEYDTTRYAGYYVFALNGIAPHQLGKTVTATLSATYNGETVTTAAENYSIKTYCYNKLNDETSSNELKKLIVDLLNYGAATETYAGSTDALVNSALSDEQKAWGTPTDVGLETVSNAQYATVDTPSAQWVGAYLTLIDTVEINFVFNADLTDGLQVKVSTKDPLDAGAAGRDYTVTEFTAYEDSGYIATFDRFDVTQMRTTLYITVLDSEGNAISNTYRYSIESYAYAKSNDADEKLVALVKAMMKYGDSARTYCPHTTIGTKADHEAHFTGCLDCALENGDREAHTLVDGVCSDCGATVTTAADGKITVTLYDSSTTRKDVWKYTEGTNGYYLYTHEYRYSDTWITVEIFDEEGNLIGTSVRLVLEGYAPDTKEEYEFGW